MKVREIKWNGQTITSTAIGCGYPLTYWKQRLKQHFLDIRMREALAGGKIVDRREQENLELRKLGIEI
jgi:hypothetical protein